MNAYLLNRYTQEIFREILRHPDQCVDPMTVYCKWSQKHRAQHDDISDEMTLVILNYIGRILRIPEERREKYAALLQ